MLIMEVKHEHWMGNIITIANCRTFMNYIKAGRVCVCWWFINSMFATQRRFSLIVASI